MKITAFDLAQRFIGTKEVSGNMDNPQVLAMLKLDDNWPEHDEVPWCSAFVNYICWLLRLPRSKKLNARSWLEVGEIMPETQASAGFDIAVLRRGDDEVSGHVGFFAGTEGDIIYLLGGNQNDSVSVAGFPKEKLLGIRRLYEDGG